MGSWLQRRSHCWYSSHLLGGRSDCMVERRRMDLFESANTSLSRVRVVLGLYYESY